MYIYIYIYANVTLKCILKANKFVPLIYGHFRNKVVFTFWTINRNRFTRRHINSSSVPAKRSNQLIKITHSNTEFMNEMHIRGDGNIKTARIRSMGMVKALLQSTIDTMR